jgi:di/tricarboxylate transporter
MVRRRYYVAVILFLAAVVAILLIFSSSLSDYGKNLSLNLAADLIGTIVVLFLIAPFIERAELRRDSVLERFDHRAFIR